MKEVIEPKSEKKEYIKPRVVDHGSAQSKTQGVSVYHSGLTCSLPVAD